MNLLTLAEHTIDESLLPLSPRVLDVGCRDFDFTRAILNLRPQATVIALDPDASIKDPHIPNCTFIPKALVGTKRAANIDLYVSHHPHLGGRNYLTSSRPFQPFDCWRGPGNRILNQHAESYTVSCCRIQDLAPLVPPTFFDLVKLDCEGSEFEILENWPGVHVARQISVEFHDGLIPFYGDGYFDSLFHSVLKDYRVIQHPLTSVGNPVMNGHWDTLLVAK